MIKTEVLTRPKYENYEFELEEDLPFDIQENLNEYWLNILERNKKTRELEYRIELMSLDDLRKLQKKNRIKLDNFV